MKKSRREFLKIAGLSALGLGAGAALDVGRNATPEARAEQMPEYKQTPEALTATHWGMVIFTSKFESYEDFKVCIDACHDYHNVPSIEGNQDVKWLWTDSFEHVFPDHPNKFLPEGVEHRDYLLLCNHCEEPPCVRVCPTKATFKRESDGIVLMDMHRCIGCRFCMAACPYGARSFNFGDPRPHIKKENPDYPTRMRGVVEKCNFCAELLAKGQMPRCVEASEGRILFGDLDDPDSDVRAALREHYSIRRKPSLGTQPSVYYII